MPYKAKNEGQADPRVIRTARLGQAFIEAISNKGFQAVSVQDITEKTGVNRTTFYLHFADKYALLDFSISDCFRRELAKRLAEADRFTLENLRGLMVTVGAFILTANAHCAPAEPQFESPVEAQVKQQLQRLLQIWQSRTPAGGEARPAIDAASAATAASWAICGLALQWSHAKKRPSVELFADRSLPTIVPMLGLRPLGEG